MIADLSWENHGRDYYRDSEKHAHCFHGFSAGSSFTVKIFAGKSTVSPDAVDSFGVSQAEDNAILAAEPSLLQHFSSSLLSLLRCGFPLLLLDVLLVGSAEAKEEHS